MNYARDHNRMRRYWANKAWTELAILTVILAAVTTALIVVVIW